MNADEENGNSLKAKGFWYDNALTATRQVVIDNHFHLLLEVPPMTEGRLSDEAFLKRLSAIYSEAFVAGAAKELADVRMAVYAEQSGMREALAAIHKRFT